MSCKHEIEMNANIGKYEEVELDYSCDKCNRSIPEEDIIHITKEQHDKREAVIEVGREFVKYKDDYMVGGMHLAMFQQALEAYEGDK